MTLDPKAIEALAQAHYEQHSAGRPYFVPWQRRAPHVHEAYRDLARREMEAAHAPA